MSKEVCAGVEEGDLVSVQESRCTNSRSLSLAGRARRIFLDCRRSYVVTVEPVIFLFMFGNYLMLFTSQQYFFWRYGEEALARNGSTADWRNACITADDLGDLVTGVQKSSSHLLSYVYVPGQVMSLFTSLVLGSLSDTLGRKFIFYSVGTGVTVQGILSFVLVWFSLDMHLFVISGVVSGMFGGFASILAAGFAFAADVSSPGKSRSVRLSLIEAMIFVAGLVSEGGAGKVLELLNCSFWPLTVVYTISGLLMILYTAVFLPEPFSRQERLQRAAGQPKGVGRLLRGVRLFFCPSSYSTWKLWAALGVLVIIVGNFVGTNVITPIFQEGPPLKWGPAMIGYYGMEAMASHGVVTLFVLPLLVALSLPDLAIALVGAVFGGAMTLFTGFVQSSWEMFLIGVLSAMEAVIAPTVRSFMSKLTSAADQGAMFAFVASSELLASIIAIAFYPNVFPLLLSHHLRPGAVYFIMAALCIAPFLLLLVLGSTSLHTHSWPCSKERLSMRGKCEEGDRDSNERDPLLSENCSKTAGSINGN